MSELQCLAVEEALRLLMEADRPLADLYTKFDMIPADRSEAGKRVATGLEKARRWLKAALEAES